jgi:hypothetical protein
MRQFRPVLQPARAKDLQRELTRPSPDAGLLSRHRPGQPKAGHEKASPEAARQQKKAGVITPARLSRDCDGRSAAAAENRPAHTGEAGHQRHLQRIAEQEGLHAIGEGLGETDTARAASHLRA